MDWYCHIDHTDDENRYVVRVTKLLWVEVDGVKRDRCGEELFRFEHQSGLSGRKLRREVEKLVAKRIETK